MATVTRRALSGSTNGRGIKVTGTTIAAAVTVHTAVAGTTDFDEIWVWAHNISSRSVRLTTAFGGTTIPDDLIVTTLRPRELTLSCPGLVLQNGLIFKARAGLANKITLHGYVNRIDY